MSHVSQNNSSTRGSSLYRSGFVFRNENIGILRFKTIRFEEGKYDITATVTATVLRKACIFFPHIAVVGVGGGTRRRYCLFGCCRFARGGGGSTRERTIHFDIHDRLDFCRRRLISRNTPWSVKRGIARRPFDLRLVMYLE